MTDTQILTLTIAVVFPVLAMIVSITTLVNSNKRVDALDKRLDDFKQEMLGSMDAFKKEITGTINTGFEHMELLLKLHVAEHHK